MDSRIRRLPQERRSADRPVNGDTRPCPHHSGGTLEFSERYRLAGKPEPAWICDRAHCPMSKPARRKRGLAVIGPALVRLASELQARARRTVMKSFARQDR